MSTNEQPAGVATINSQVRMNPEGRVRHIFGLFAPGYIGLETVVDHGNPDPLRGVKAPDVAIHIGAAYTQRLVSGSEPPAMDENQNRPIRAVRKEQVEPVLLISRALPIANVPVHLPILQHH